LTDVAVVHVTRGAFQSPRDTKLRVQKRYGDASVQRMTTAAGVTALPSRAVAGPTGHVRRGRCRSTIVRKLDVESRPAAGLVAFPQYGSPR
jgi:hypothetical protein